MHVHAPNINALFGSQIRDLARLGVAPSPSECVWLWELCQRCVAQPDVAGPGAYSEKSVERCGIVFRVPSIAAMLWLEEKAAPWCDGDPLYATLAEGYALARGHERGAFDGMAHQQDAKRKLRDWYYDCGLTLAQLREIIDEFSGQPARGIELESPNEVKQPPSRADWGWVVARICAKFGGVTPDALVREYPLSVVSDLLRKAYDMDAEDTAQNYVRELEELRLAVKEIARRHGCC